MSLCADAWKQCQLGRMANDRKALRGECGRRACSLWKLPAVETAGDTGASLFLPGQGERGLAHSVVLREEGAVLGLVGVGSMWTCIGTEG